MGGSVGKLLILISRRQLQVSGYDEFTITRTRLTFFLFFSFLKVGADNKGGFGGKGGGGGAVSVYFCVYVCETVVVYFRVLICSILIIAQSFLRLLK